MRAECITEVTNAVGRSLTQPEIKGIEDRIRSNMKALARQDIQAWRAMPEADRLTRAAEMARDQLIAEAGKRRQRVALQVGAVQRIADFVDAAKARGERRFDAMFRYLEQTEIYAKGVRNQYFSQLVDTMESVHGRLLGLIEDRAVARALVQEIFGADSGSQVAKAGAKAWLDTVEAMRQRFNAAGGDVGRLDYGYIPQPHDSARVLSTGQAPWVDAVLPLLDKSRYVHEDGRAFTEAEIRGFLSEAWKTISSDGLNKIESPRPPGGSMLANRGAQSREIHFAGPDEYMAYMDEFGRSGVLASMQSHVGALARNIALVERMGPNPDATFRTLYDDIRKTGESTRVAGRVLDIESVWETMSGKLNNPRWAGLARVSQGARNVEVASKLGSAVLSSVTDIPTLVITTGYHRLPFLQMATNVVRAFGRGDAEFANRAGLIADSIIGDMNRWSEGNVGPGWTAKMAGATMKASLMNAWTDSLRRGFSITMMGALGRLSKSEWSALPEYDRLHMGRAGVTEADFNVWRLAQLEDWRGSSMLTPEAIKAIPDAALQPLGNPQRLRDQAITKLLGYVTDESEFASVNPDLITRTIKDGASRKGTVTGEMWRSVMLFKSFPIAMISRHWRRSLDESMSVGQRFGYGIGLMAGMYAFGSVALSLKDIRDGKDPRDMTEPRAIAAAFAQGGGLGILGDFVFTDTSRFGRTMLETQSGPVFSTLAALWDLTWGNVQQATKGEDTDIGAEFVQFAKSILPAWITGNIWYTKAVVERALTHDLQEMLSPGYLARMKQRARRDFGQDYFWEPGEFLPRRPPDATAAIGE